MFALFYIIKYIEDFLWIRPERTLFSGFQSYRKARGGYWARYDWNKELEEEDVFFSTEITTLRSPIKARIIGLYIGKDHFDFRGAIGGMTHRPNQWYPSWSMFAAYETDSLGDWTLWPRFDSLSAFFASKNKIAISHYKFPIDFEYWD